MISPLLFDYPEDDNLANDDTIASTFKFGRHLMIVPVLQEGVTEKYSTYIPEDRWVLLHNGTRVSDYGEGARSRIFNGSWIEPVNVLVRGGAIVPLLDSQDK